MLISTRDLNYVKAGDPKGEAVHMYVYEFPIDQIEMAVEFLKEVKSRVFMNAEAIHAINEDDLTNPTDLDHFKWLLKQHAIGGVFFINRTDALLFQLKTGAKAVLNAPLHISINSTSS